LRVEIDLDRHGSREELERLHQLFLRHEGRMALRLRLCSANWQAELVPARVVGINPNTLIPAISTVLGPGRTDFVFGL
jgi:hypothetical protein